MCAYFTSLHPRASLTAALLSFLHAQHCRPSLTRQAHHPQVSSPLQSSIPGGQHPYTTSDQHDNSCLRSLQDTNCNEFAFPMRADHHVSPSSKLFSTPAHVLQTCRSPCYQLENFFPMQDQAVPRHGFKFTPVAPKSVACRPMHQLQSSCRALFSLPGSASFSHMSNASPNWL